MAKKFTVRKYNGDDSYSWAVFLAADVKGSRGIVFPGQARPVVNGCSRSEANHYRDSLESREA